MGSMIISTLIRTLLAGTPLLLGTLGEIVTERSGVLNLGVEGMMAIGAMTAFTVTLTTGSPWFGLLAAFLAGALAGGIHPFVSITLKANQVVSGLALTMLGLGVSGLFGRPFIGRPLPSKLSTLPIPGLADIPVLGRILFSQDPLFYLAVILGILLWILLSGFFTTIVVILIILYVPWCVGHGFLLRKKKDN